MSIDFSCDCGQVISAPENLAGRMVRCPHCKQGVQVPAAADAYGEPAPVQPLNYAGGGGVPGGPIAPPPGVAVRVPTTVPEKLRSTGLPPCYLVMNTHGANVNAGFDVSPAMEALVEGFAKQLRKRFNVQIVSSAPAGAPAASVRLVNVDEGNRWLRYFLTLFAGKTVFEVEGEVVTPDGQRIPFFERHKGAGGVFGGSALNLLKLSARYVGKKIAKKIPK